jgi:hypothetical protein
MACRGRRVAVEGEEAHEVLELEKFDASLRASGGREGERADGGWTRAVGTRTGPSRELVMVASCS